MNKPECDLADRKLLDKKQIMITDLQTCQSQLTGAYIEGDLTCYEDGSKVANKPEYEQIKWAKCDSKCLIEAADLQNATSQNVRVLT